MNGEPTRVRRSSRRAPEHPRAQATSGITTILEALLEGTPGARAVALVDFEGETVDYAGAVDPFDLKVTAAHFRIVLSELGEARSFGEIRTITVRARTSSFFVHQIHAEYALVVVLHRHAAFATSERAVHDAASGLAREAGWAPPKGPRWHRVSVKTSRGDRARPTELRVGRAWQEVEVMGSIVGLRDGERGFRVRVRATGHEVLLVRERLGVWFADEHVG